MVWRPTSPLFPSRYAFLPHLRWTVRVYVRLGLIVVLKGETTLPWWSYIIALILGAFVAPFSNLLFARLGNGIATNQLMKMVAGAVNPGKPVANLYVCIHNTRFVRFRLTKTLVLNVEPRCRRDLNQLGR